MSSRRSWKEGTGGELCKRGMKVDAGIMRWEDMIEPSQKYTETTWKQTTTRGRPRANNINIKKGGGDGPLTNVKRRKVTLREINVQVEMLEASSVVLT